MKTNKRLPQLPIGRTARFAFDLDVTRADCSEVASQLCQKKKLDELELEECARLDDALAEAQRVLKAAVRNIMLDRIKRRSRRTRAR